ncbi:MAG: hypothetical protein M3068_12825 [Gemmatimonadota bacterium]|nr:hypothetical protein [Gemmatimonadota bacterium]
MKASLLYRIASGLLLLFAIGHTLGFRRVEPRWGLDSIIASLRSTRFDVQGFSRTYWDFYTGFGLFVTVLLLFAAALAWQLGDIPTDVLKRMPIITWALAASFVAVTLLSWRYFFIAPLVFSGAIAVVLLVSAWAAGKP